MPQVATGGSEDMEVKSFEEMVNPPLADRVRAFEQWLDVEPCTNLVNGLSACQILSASSQMCPACRLRLHFYHCTYNAEAYEGGPGAIPRKSA